MKTDLPQSQRLIRAFGAHDGDRDGAWARSSVRASSRSHRWWRKTCPISPWSPSICNSSAVCWCSGAGPGPGHRPVAAGRAAATLSSARPTAGWQASFGAGGGILDHPHGLHCRPGLRLCRVPPQHPPGHYQYHYAIHSDVFTYWEERLLTVGVIAALALVNVRGVQVGGGLFQFSSRRSRSDPCSPS